MLRLGAALVGTASHSQAPDGYSAVSPVAFSGTGLMVIGTVSVFEALPVVTLLTVFEGADSTSR